MQLVFSSIAAHYAAIGDTINNLYKLLELWVK